MSPAITVTDFMPDQGGDVGLRPPVKEQCPIIDASYDAGLAVLT
jgi:hypothetical protein